MQQPLLPQDVKRANDVNEVAQIALKWEADTALYVRPRQH